jgi:hypothetical protein
MIKHFKICYFLAIYSVLRGSIESKSDKIISQIDVQQVVRMDYLVSAPEIYYLLFVKIVTLFL